MGMFGTAVLVTGKESLLSDRAVEERLAAAQFEQPGAECNRIQASELAEVMLSEVVGGSLLSSHTIAIIEDVGTCPPEMIDPLLTVAKDPRDELCLILVHPGGVKGKGLIDKLKKAKIETVVVEAPKPWEVWRFVQAEAKRRGLRTTQEAAEALVGAVGTDLRSIVAAVSQLAQDIDTDELDMPLIRRYFAGRAEVTSFSIADAMLVGNASVALERLRWALATGTTPVMITSAIAGNFRHMGKFLDHRGERLSDGDLAKRLGIPFFKVRDLRQQSRYWDQRAVASSIQLIAQADADVKGAATDPGHALEQLVLRVLATRSS